MNSKKIRFIKKLILLIVIVSVVVGIGFAGIEITSSPWFCNRCHEMNIYFDAWLLSNHGSRGDCTICHVKQGFLNFLKAKFNGFFSLLFHILGKRQVEVSLPVICLREGCHVLEKIDTVERKKEVEKTVTMNHVKHVELIRKIGTRYDCIPCHKDIAHGQERKFMPDMKEICYICHSELDIRYQNCVTCHPVHPLIEGEVEEIYEIHKEEGVGCEDCHIDLHKANTISCNNCHDESYTKYTTFHIKK